MERAPALSIVFRLRAGLKTDGDFLTCAVFVMDKIKPGEQDCPPDFIQGRKSKVFYKQRPYGV